MEFIIEFIAIAYVLFGAAVLIVAHINRHGNNNEDSISLSLGIERFKRWIKSIVNQVNIYNIPL